MPSPLLEHLSRGNFNFLRSEPTEILRAVPALEDLLPTPSRIFLEDETAEPLVGFPVLQSRSLRALEVSLNEYLQAEEERQTAVLTRDAIDSRTHAARWERYQTLLAKVLRSSISSSYGARYPEVFFIHHSQLVASYLRAVPKRMIRRDLTMGRELGDEIKYRVFYKWGDQVIELTRSIVRELAEEYLEDEESLFPRLLAKMYDNVLIFTEEHVSPDLGELSSYFNGCLKIDGRDLRQRLASLKDWHSQNLRGDALLRGAVRHLLGCELEDPVTRLLIHPGYLSYLTSHITYSTSHFPNEEQVEIWEKLLARLKEYEVYLALRKMVVPVEVEDGHYVSRDRSTNMTWIGGPPVLRLSPATRPLDFTSTWVVDPLVERFGLVYDISDFSATISMLGRAEKTAIENAFRTTYAFQRKVNTLADSFHLRLEKYLGDGAFYSGRHAKNLIVVAIHIQRLYEQAIREGFPFNRGLRVAVNYGEYRLLPLETGGQDEKVRYEYFGHGLVELARLTTGKKTEEIEELKNYLVGQGYPEHTVARFFEPLMRKSSDLVNKDEESRRFFAYINQNRTLINEGIVATEPFLRLLEKPKQLFYAKEGRRGYIVLPIEEKSGETLHVGVRKLGVGNFKGLEQMPIFELVDAASWRLGDDQKIPTTNLMAALEKLFAAVFTARSEPSKTGLNRPAVLDEDSTGA